MELQDEMILVVPDVTIEQAEGEEEVTIELPFEFISVLLNATDELQKLTVEGVVVDVIDELVEVETIIELVFEIETDDIELFEFKLAVLLTIDKDDNVLLL